MKWSIFVICAAVLGLVVSSTVHGVYVSGQPKRRANPAKGNNDSEFLLFKSQSGCAPAGLAVQHSNIAVANRVFAVTPDFRVQTGFLRSTCGLKPCRDPG